MSEENPEAPVIENEAEAVEEGLGVATETLEETAEEVVESPEDKIARLENEVKAERAKVEKAQRGIVKVRRKNDSKLKRATLELEQTKAELYEYKGEQAQPKQQQLSEADQMRIAEYNVKCNELGRDKEFNQLYQERVQDNSNPFTENPLIDQVMAHHGVDPSIAKFILNDDELCEELGDSENPYEIMAIIGRAKEREKHLANKPKEPIKKPVNTPKSIPSLKTNNANSNSAKNYQSNEDWYVSEFLASKRK
jgi:hypothetical protein